MQCPSCQFQNMPGSKNCARCGANLALNDLKIDVNPPRASRLQRATTGRTDFRLRRFLFSLSDAARSIFGLNSARSGVEFEWNISSCLSLLIPGLTLLRSGERTGWFWLIGWLLLLLCSVLFAGLSFGSMTLGLAVALHIASFVEVFGRAIEAIDDRVRFTLLSALLLGCLYYSCIRGIGSIVTPIQVLDNMVSFDAGDVAWYSRRFQPNVGDLVVYDLPDVTYMGRRNGYAAQIRLGGQRINRILANSGQKVSWRRTQLLVDGKPLVGQSTAALYLFPEFEMVVPTGQMFVLPENLITDPAVRVTTDLAKTLSLVSTDRIRGPVLFRSYPFYRFEIF